MISDLKSKALINWMIQIFLINALLLMTLNGYGQEPTATEDIQVFKKDRVAGDNKSSSKDFFNITEINYCPGFGKVTDASFQFSIWGPPPEKNNDQSFGIRTVTGICINRVLALGAGIGIDKYKEAFLVPFTLDFYQFINIPGRIVPFFNESIGLSFANNTIEEEDKDGLIYNKGGLIINIPSAGVRIRISDKVAYVFRAGLKWQTQKVSGYNYNESNLSFFISINTGFSF
jgi:hypothetical protein